MRLLAVIATLVAGSSLCGAPALADSRGTLLPVGALLTGAAGDTRPLRFGVRNPTSAVTEPHRVTVTLPPGVDVAQSDSSCTPIGPRQFTCAVPPQLTPGAQRIYTFSVLLGESAGVAGTVTADGVSTPIQVVLTSGAEAPATDLPIGTIALVGASLLLIGAGALLKKPIRVRANTTPPPSDPPAASTPSPSGTPAPALSTH